MQVHIWVGKQFLEQLNKNINSPLATGDDWDNVVEYTDMVAMEGQLEVSIKYDKYIELTDKGLLIEWSGINQE
jgi:hypothetical protein